MSKLPEPVTTWAAKRLLSAIYGSMRNQKANTIYMRDGNMARNARMKPIEIPAALAEIREANILTIAQGRRGCTFTLKPLAI